jgi:hypothetical protein
MTEFKKAIELLFPPARFVEGSLSVPNTKDADGNALKFKSGPMKDQEGRCDYYFAVAIKKGQEKHWNETEWGKKVWAVGVDGFPSGEYKAPSFAWKISDGDCDIPNRGKRPCDKEGFAGCWIVKFSGGFEPQLYDSLKNPIQNSEYIKRGFYIEVYAQVASNKSMMSPGVYLNHRKVCFRAYGKEIIGGYSVEDIPFGQSPLPAEALEMPEASQRMPEVSQKVEESVPFKNQF